MLGVSAAPPFPPWRKKWHGHCSYARAIFLHGDIAMTAFTLFAQQADNGGALVGGALAFMVIFWVLAAAAMVFWIWMLIDVLTSNRDTSEKILWFLVVFFLHFVGAIIYFVVARRRSGSAAIGAI
jgi:hypothetical protein